MESKFSRQPKGGTSSSKTSKAALYTRVSTHYQIDKDSLPFQRQELINYCKFALNIEDYVVFEDAGYSGKNTDRPSYQDMMSRICAGEFTHLMVWKIDRISRNLLDFAKMYEELKKYKCTFVSKNEQFDTSSAMGEAMLKIILIFAELERKLTGERVTSIMYSRAEKGLWNGAPIPIGYKWNDEIKYPVIDEEQAVVVRYIYDKYQEINSAYQLAHHLNEISTPTKRGGRWTSKTVSDVIRNPFYKGTYRYNYKSNTGTLKPLAEQIIHEDNHEAIISKEQWERCNHVMDLNGGTRNVAYLRSNIKYVHIFSIILKCGYCGATMGGGLDAKRADGFQPSKYYCVSHNTVRGCPNKMVTDVTLGPFIFNYIHNFVTATQKPKRGMTIKSLEKLLLFGPEFSFVAGIEAEGLEQAFNSIVCGKSGNAPMDAVGDDAIIPASEIDVLTRDKAKYERALERLNSLYLYSDESMAEKDYLLKKREFMTFLDDIDNKLHQLHNKRATGTVSVDFAYNATYFYLANHLNRKRHIAYREMVSTLQPEILKEFINSIIEKIIVKDGLVTSITFANGLTHNFIYKQGTSRKPPSHGPDGKFRESK